MENEIKEKTQLLDRSYHLVKQGWARRPYWDYKRKELNRSPFVIKEWDYYQIIDSKETFALNITFSDLGLFSLVSLSYVDKEKKDFAQESALKFFTKNKTGLAESPEEDYRVTYSNEKISLTIVKKGEKRQIIANVPSLTLPDGKKGLLADLVIYDENHESMNIATSWKEDRTKFYYNEKRGPMRVQGTIRRDMEISSLDGYALLDWGRGVWLRESTWIWAALMDESFLINLGGGFTDRSPASENAIIYDGVVNKIENVIITPPDDLISGPWIFKDEKERLYLEMTTIVNRKDHQDYKIIVSKQDQVFGLYNGYFILDSGEKIEVKDKFGFAEKVFNIW